MESRSLLSFLAVGIALVIALGSLPSCGGGGGGGGSGGGGDEPGGTNDTTVTVPIDSGGSIEFPPGSLPKNATVTVKATRTPILPDYAQALGAAIAIEVNAALQKPAWLHLPIPAGVADPTKLAIFRVEADGTVTEHLTSVDGSELIAPTLGFSTFSIAERSTEEFERILSGPAELMPGETAQYRIKTSTFQIGDHTPRVADAQWTHSGPWSSIETQGVSAIVQVANTVAAWTDASIAVSFVDRGFRCFGAKTVRVSPIAITSVSLTTLKPTIYAGEEFTELALFTAHTLGITPPITWSWNFGDGETGGPVTTNDRTFSLPPKKYAAPYRSWNYKVSINAQSGPTIAIAETGVTVIRPPLEVSISGPQRLQWSDPQVSAEYNADASGGKPPYLYFSSLAPSGFEGTPGLSVQTITFDQPGGHRLKVTAEDFRYDQASTTIPVTVEGGEALHTHMLDLPANAEAGAPVTVPVQVRGGVLVVSGQKAGYEFHFDWGDGTTVVQNDVLLTGTPFQGIVIPMSHTYAAAGTYPVTVKVYDATGSSAEDQREIAIGAPSTVWIVGTWNSSGYADFGDSTSSSSGTFTFNSDGIYVHDFDWYHSGFGGSSGHSTIAGIWSLDGGVLVTKSSDALFNCPGSAPDNATKIVLSCENNNPWVYTLTR